jgi:hypothetical protein
MTDRDKHFKSEMPGGALNWEQFERLAPECSARWDVDGGPEWQGEDMGPALHLSWNRDQCLLAVVWNDKGLYRAARWDGDVLGWRLDAASGTLAEVMDTRSPLDPVPNVRYDSMPDFRDMWRSET